ncbi:MAG: tripartite tricarboxylate transporter permease, partial [Rhodobacteraceae bacterium]|nr:tripartite tricarboxylate transporter permease [Paracoccaceae bacterium]
MLETIALGFQQLAEPVIWIALISGSVLGVVLGAIPGIGPGVGIVLLLPVTYTMDPLAGMTLLMGLYAAGWYGGAIPAITINTPGTGVNVLTTYDGYPMAKGGEPQRALSLAYASSFVGGIFAVVVLVIAAWPLAALSKYLTSVDLGMAALLAMVLVVVAHRGSEFASFAMLGVGLFVSTIGLETAYGSARYTFGTTWMMGGVPLISMILGLFALSQALTLIFSDRVVDKSETEVDRRLLSGFVEVFRYPKTLFRSAGFGVGMGVLPGVGEFLAQFFAYTTARAGSKTPEKFGRGAPEGIIASETANNAVPPAALVPLLSLGIPGEAFTAMMLTVFIVHGVDPGPTLFEDNKAFVAGLYMTLFIMNFIIVGLLLVGTRWIARLSMIDDRLLGVIIMCLVMVGTFSRNYRLSDTLIAICFGVLGFALRRANIPMVPMILGLVLGPIMERSFRQG